jgi:hypothetical protein
VEGFARWSIDLESSSGNSDVIVRDNVIRDGVVLAGILAFNQGDSSGTYLLEGNHFDNIGLRPHFFWTFDTASLHAEILDSSADNIGALGQFSAFANSDSILLQLSGSSTMDVVVDGYTYDNTDQVGGISNTGLEVVFWGEGFAAPAIWANGAEATLRINNSRFSNAVTEAMQFNNVGLDSVMSVEITNSTILDANPGQIPGFLNGPLGTDLAGSAISLLTGNFLVPSGSGASQVSLSIENSDIIGSTGYAVGVYDTNTDGFSATVDLGGGSLGSSGHNRILDNVVGEIELYRSNGIGSLNWWGEDPPRVDITGGGAFVTAPELTADPRP